MLKKWFFRSKRKRKQKEVVHEVGFQADKRPLQKNLDEMIHSIRHELGDCPDVVVRMFHVGHKQKRRVAAIYIEGIIDEEKVNDFVARSLLLESVEADAPRGKGSTTSQVKWIYNMIWKRALTVGDVKDINEWNGMIYCILSGDVVILIDGCATAIVGSTRGGETRSISEPKTEVNIRGPLDSFTESIGTNTSLIRRRLKSPNLRLERMRVGKISQTEISLIYLKGIAEDRLVAEIKQRLNDIQIDAILESGNLEELVQDETFTPFPTVFNTERPDVAVGNLLEGRIALLVDGTPNTLILPTTFSQFFKAAEDYYQRFDFAVFMRLIRYFSFFTLLLLPSIYISVTAYHHEMIPTPLAINLVAQREGVPFPVVFEALLMEVAFETMREAGTRMPRAVGQAVSIVGAVVLGQAAVEAGIVTAMMVIIVAFTGIASFTMPGFTLATSARLIRFPMMLAAATLGFYGVIMGVILLVAHMSSLRSFGIPYLSPFAPFGFKHQKDTIWRIPFKKPTTRPDMKNSVHHDVSSSSSQSSQK
ncbi:spore germination protein [Halalkalibacterium halodurans]|uniref:spore germination protein n=1 Tax=Halalkalibacterium halodurans TaxID=86665 RepID=UPI002AAA19A9|nr:spore germination protein [Halalkalibacterium halodurans]MDY7222459.1 spore germination protein [Halalkalibacterium halodurans]MDY7241680.1 spore germination protein [Halalkalibacterium halodurans]